MKIQLLDPLVAQRIAAGEVIERPASVIRELLDNALDAGAKTIVASVTDGGLEEIKLIDDGEGIEPEDILSCAKAMPPARSVSLMIYTTSRAWASAAKHCTASPQYPKSP